MGRFDKELKRKKLKKNEVVGYLKKLPNGLYKFTEVGVKNVVNKKVTVNIDGNDIEFNEDGLKNNSDDSLEQIPKFISDATKQSAFVRNAQFVSIVEINEATRDHWRYVNALN